MSIQKLEHALVLSFNDALGEALEHYRIMDESSFRYLFTRKLCGQLGQEVKTAREHEKMDLVAVYNKIKCAFEFKFYDTRLRLDINNACDSTKRKGGPSPKNRDEVCNSFSNLNDKKEYDCKYFILVAIDRYKAPSKFADDYYFENENKLINFLVENAKVNKNNKITRVDIKFLSKVHFQLKEAEIFGWMCRLEEPKDKV